MPSIGGCDNVPETLWGIAEISSCPPGPAKVGPMNWDGVNKWTGTGGGFTVTLEDHPQLGPRIVWSKDCGGGGQISPQISCSPSFVAHGIDMGNYSANCCTWEGSMVPITIGETEPDLSKMPIWPPPPVQVAPLCPPHANECECAQQQGDGNCQGGMCQPRTALFSEAPIRFATGELLVESIDLAADGYGVPWGHRRSFSSRLQQKTNIGSGFNWQVKEWTYLAFQDDGTIVVMGLPHQALWFDHAGSTFVPRFGVKFSLALDEAASVYRLNHPDGSITEYFQDSGILWRHVDPAGNVLRVFGLHSNGLYLGEVRRSSTVDSTTTIDRYVYEYTTPATGLDVLTSVTLQRKIGATDWTDIRRASYTYYGSSDANGALGDLKTVTTEVMEDEEWKETGKTLYRYYKTLPTSSSSSSSSSGTAEDAHLLKYVVNPASYERLKADPNVTDPLTASDAIVAQYADYYFEYDQQRRVTKESIHGGSKTYEFSYSQSAFADGYNNWKYKTVETLPSGAQNIVFSNYTGQTMLKVFKSGNDQWCEFFKFDASGQPILHAMPSAVSGYDEQYADLLHEVSGNYEFLRDSTGLIRTYTYHSPSGYQASESIQQGELGTPIKLREYEYVSCCPSGSSSSSSSSSSSGSGAGCVWHRSRETVYPSDTDQTKKTVTTFDYTFHPGTCAIQQKTTTWPAVPTDQNGSGVAANKKEVFDTYGNLSWIMDERGFITRLKYDIPTGALVQRIDDVDTAQVTDEPAGWQTTTGGGLHLVTDFEHDDQGRITQVLGPSHSVDLNGAATTVRRATWTVYKDADHQVWTAQGYATGSAPNYTYTLINPVSIVRRDENDLVLEQIQATRTSTSGKLQASDSFPQSSYVLWTTNQYTDCCLLSATRVYHTIPASGTGSPGTNYDETVFGYDSLKRRNRHVTPGGTITRIVFDILGRPQKMYVGTNDNGATASDPTGGGATGNNMVLVTEHQYDGGGVGDGNLTQTKQWVDASTSRVTTFSYDWRNRRTATDGEVDYYEKTYYDNLDRVIKTERYNTTANGNLIARSETKFDDWGRVYQTVRYGVNPSTGAVGNSLTDNTWYDAAGNVIKQLPSGAKLFTKSFFDGLGRRTKQYQGYDADETAYGEASSVSDDTIMEQTELAYDAASNVIQTTLRQRYHNATGTGELTSPSGAQPKARVTLVASWHDPLGRQLATANYGTNGGTSLTRPNTVPARSDTVLVTSQEYNSAGNLVKQTNPGSIATCFEYDAAGRQTKVIMNCTSGSSSSTSSSSSSGSAGCLPSDDTNVTVITAYNADGNVASITAVNAITGNQTTQYVYGTTLTDSAIVSSLLKRKEIYPDSADDDDVISFKYNRQGQVTEVRDQNGTVHAYDYDLLGQQIHDRVTTLGTGVDGAVRRISTTYEVRGMREKITSYDSATVGSGSIVNEVQFAYNDFGQIIADYQAHSGAVNTSTTPKVQYGYANGSANHIRSTTLTYPNGRVLNYDYGSAGGADDALSRVASLIDNDGSTHLVDYSYLGRNTFVVSDYPEPDIKWTLIGTAGGDDPDTGDIYWGLDRFGRVKDCCWYNYGTSADVDRIKYGYNRNGNRTYRENVVATANNAYFDEKYAHDLIDRLKHMDRGRLTAQKDSVTNKTFAQCWSLDATGNWRKLLEDSNGDGTWDLDQLRTSNQVNETADTSETSGPAWATPAYNRAGNMTTIPKPADPTQTFTATFNAWNRLINLEDSSATVAKYEYDGANRRTVTKSYSGGTLIETKHLLYTEPAKWQVIEECVDSFTNPNCQYVWGHRYIDDLVLRDRDTDANGSLNERLYATQDANWNVFGVVNSAGVIQERYAYTAFGCPVILSSTFVSRAASLYLWEIGYCGYRHDARSALYDSRRRSLHSGLGVWLQRDPLACSHDTHLYAYAANAPLIHIDPSGGRWVVAGTTPAICVPIARFTSTSPRRRHARGAICLFECVCPAGSSHISTQAYTFYRPCIHPPAPNCIIWANVPDPEPCPRPIPLPDVKIECVKVTSEGLAVTTVLVIALAILIALLDSPAPGPLDAVAVAILIAFGIIPWGNDGSDTSCRIV